jgi:hypothetical protein
MMQRHINTLALHTNFPAFSSSHGSTANPIESTPRKAILPVFLFRGIVISMEKGVVNNA